MAGFVLGFGSGALAGAAIYYTLATDTRRQTSVLRQELAYQTAVLSNSFTPHSQPAPSTFVGPQQGYEPSLGDLVRQRWNSVFTGAVTGVRDTNWAAVGRRAVEEGRGIAARLGGDAVSGVEGGAADVAKDVAKEGVKVVQDVVERAGEVVGDVAKKAGKEVEVLAGRAGADVEVFVDRKIQPGDADIKSPKRLV